MSAAGPVQAIIIPAKDECRRIGPCLHAIAVQEGGHVPVILIVNNTTDATAKVAAAAGRAHGLDLTILEVDIDPAEGVGAARGIGCEHALRMFPDLSQLLTTDADCLVAKDWLRRNLDHLPQADAVCGKITPIESESDVLAKMNPEYAASEGAYRQLVLWLYANFAEGCADLEGSHGEAPGASLAITPEAYRAVGGFAPIKCSEDRHIIRALRLAGFTICHADDVKVRASCRVQGRAEGGMADAISARISGKGYLIDDGLPSSSWLLRRTERGALGTWPPAVAMQDRVDVRDIARHIEALEQFQTQHRQTARPATRARTDLHKSEAAHRKAAHDAERRKPMPLEVID